jgi:hypothetical protein
MRALSQNWQTLTDEERKSYPSNGGRKRKLPDELEKIDKQHFKKVQETIESIKVQVGSFLSAESSR